MRRLAMALIAAGSLIVAGAGIANAASVSAEDFEFIPSSITVDTGEAITFTNNGAAPHTATADDGSFDTGNLAPGDSGTVTISAPGTYPYYCVFHGGPGGVGMAGTITVVSAGGGGPAPSTASPLPLIAGIGVVLLIGGLLLGRRRTRPE